MSSNQKSKGTNEDQDKQLSNRERKRLEQGSEYNQEKANAINVIKSQTQNMYDNFGRDYEKDVNQQIKNQLSTGQRKVYFKTNIQITNDESPDIVSNEWKKFQKQPDVQDDLTKKSDKKNQPKPNINLLPVNLQNTFAPIKNLEIDGIAYVPQNMQLDKTVRIKIDDQEIKFKTPCLILIESTVVSDKMSIINKLIQLMKGYVFAKMHLPFFARLLSDEKCDNSFTQHDEAISTQLQFLTGYIQVHLLCVTNNNREEGSKSYTSAWDTISKMFDLSRISFMFSQENADLFKQNEFQENHVHHIHIQSTICSDFIHEFKSFKTSNDKLEADVKAIQGQMTNMEGEMKEMKGQMKKMEGHMKNMEVGMNGKIDEVKGEIKAIIKENLDTMGDKLLERLFERLKK